MIWRRDVPAMKVAASRNATSRNAVKRYSALLPVRYFVAGIACLVIPQLAVSTAQAFESKTTATPTAAAKSQPATTTTSKRRKKKSAQPAAADVGSLEQGIAAARAGNYPAAIASLTTAIDSGNLQFKDTARALYYRGMSYRHTDEQAKAISDLTSALWKKGALDATERNGALAERAAAYRAAGLADHGVATSAIPAGPATASPATATPPPPPRIARAEPAPAARPQQKAWTTGAARPIPATAPETTSGAGSFFQNLFGGASSSASQPGSGNSAASPSPAQRPRASPQGDQISAWSTNTQGPAAGPESKPARKPRPAEAAAPDTRSPGGRLAIQVAALRSRTDAEALARQLGQRHAKLLATRAPVIESNVMGNMGTLYIVRIGPYRTESETVKLCTKLRSDGLDCLLLTGR